LAREGALLEIEAVAVLPPEAVAVLPPAKKPKSRSLRALPRRRR
jgi:hypothetical protein